MKTMECIKEEKNSFSQVTHMVATFSHSHTLLILGGGHEYGNI